MACPVQACNTFRMYNGKAAEGELKGLAELSNGSYMENDLIRHNLVVFRGGESALQVPCRGRGKGGGARREEEAEREGERGRGSCRYRAGGGSTGECEEKASSGPRIPVDWR